MSIATPAGLLNVLRHYFKGSASTLAYLRALEDQAARLRQYQAIQQTITRLIAVATTLDQALPRILQTIGEATHWEFGEIWYVEKPGGVLSRIASWHMTGVDFPAFEAVSQQITFAPGKGLPGRVWESGRPAWVQNVVKDDHFLRAAAADRDGLHGATAVPLRTEGELIGAMVLFTRQKRPIDNELLHLLDTIDSQVGLYVERKCLELAEREQARTLAALEERQRVARDLHDSVTQTLFSAMVIADMLPQILQRDPAQAQLQLNDLSTLTRDALSEMRALLVELRPTAPESATLAQALEKLIGKLSKGQLFTVALNVQGECQLPPGVQEVIYRIAQETLNNVAKHAFATQVMVDLHCDAETIILRICDNGRGFDPSRAPVNHFGLGIMSERAQTIGAIFTLSSQPGTGTKAELSWKRSTNEVGRQNH